MYETHRYLIKVISVGSGAIPFQIEFSHLAQTQDEPSLSSELIQAPEVSLKNDRCHVPKANLSLPNAVRVKVYGSDAEIGPFSCVVCTRFESVSKVLLAEVWSLW